MLAYMVTEVKKTERGSIVHIVDRLDGRTETIVYSSIRGGLSWPTPEASGYFIILAEEYRDFGKFEAKDRGERGKIRLLAEHEANSLYLDEFFRELTDSCSLLHCRKVYADLREDFEEVAEYYREFKYKEKVPFGTLEEAPYCKDFQLGLSITRRWLDKGLLEIPKDSIVYGQLKAITKEDLGDHPEKRFSALNALRLVMASFHKAKGGRSMAGYQPDRSRGFR